MRGIEDIYTAPKDLVLGLCLNARVPEVDQKRQRLEVDEILDRLRKQPGVVLADEVGMGKTYVALGVAYSVAIQSPRGPVIVMVPSNLIDKWEQDLKAFCDLYLVGRKAIRVDLASEEEKTLPTSLRYGRALNSVELMKLLDDDARIRSHMIFLAQGAMSRQQTDKWVRLALIAEALRRHGRGGANRLIQVKKQIHRFLAELLWAIGVQKAQDLGEDLWQTLLRSDPAAWREIFNKGFTNGEQKLTDDPVPKAVVRSLDRVDLKSLAEALREMPVRARGGEERTAERLSAVRTRLREIEEELWKDVLRKSHWRSPLLVMDEAHHLKNPETALARQLQSSELTDDLNTGDGAMAGKFDRMLFLTATPFQLGHRELVRVLERFEDVRWDEGELGTKESLSSRLKVLREELDESQRGAIGLRRAWGALRPEDQTAGENADAWWGTLLKSNQEALTSHQRAVLDAFRTAKSRRDAAEKCLRPWLVRHNKGEWWSGTTIRRRNRSDGAAIAGRPSGSGLPIPPTQLLPFFLAARSAVRHDRDLLGDALCSSYEAFRDTRKNRQAAKDEQAGAPKALQELSRAGWYLEQFDGALEKLTGAVHPKVSATAQRVLDLWEKGEKVLVFAFYRHSCRALRVHISAAIERHIQSLALKRLRTVSPESDESHVTRLIEKVHKRFFDDPDSPGRRAMDRAISGILEEHREALERAAVAGKQREELQDIFTRFLRVESTLARCFPLEALDIVAPAEAVRRTLDSVDASGVSWREKFGAFVAFLAEQCTADERGLYLEVAASTKTGRIRVERDEDDQIDGRTEVLTLANVQVATGTTKRETRSRLMRAFNTPFFPDVLVCSEVMGEGVDLQRFCRHVIHHDLDWNPSTIEQRTGRIDRLGCKAEGRQPIEVYLPYLAGTADERQYQVMLERERWFRVVMGQEKVAELITADSSCAVPLPASASEALAFDLGLQPPKNRQNEREMTI